LGTLSGSYEGMQHTVKWGVRLLESHCLGVLALSYASMAAIKYLQSYKLSKSSFHSKRE